MRPNIASRLEPSTPTLQDLISQIDEGEVKVPAFQRRFVWKDTQALELLDSLASNYPVGSLLLWRTGDKLVTDRNIGDFTLPETDDHSPTDYVLDGQQRLTVIYSCLGAAEESSGFAAGYDLLEDAGFVPLPENPPVHVFPLRILFRTSRLLDFRTALQAHPKGHDLQKDLDNLVRVLTGYRLPVVTLKNLTLDEVCPIFERINSSGTRLSIYDLMVAATWSRNFDLNERAKQLATALEGKDFDEVQGTTLLKVLSALDSNSTDRESIIALRGKPATHLDTLVERAKGALERAVDFFVTEFRVHSLDFLPYEAHLVILAAIFGERKALSDLEVRRVRQWFWRSAFTEHYRGASESFVNKSLAATRSFVLDNAIAADEFGGMPTIRTLLRLGFRKNGAGARAFALAMAKRGPRNITNGSSIDAYSALSVYNKHQFHHIFPQAFLKRTDADADPNRLMNICLLAASENNAISDAEPNVYLPELVNRHGVQAEAIFGSNLLPGPTGFDYGSCSYDDFLEARANAAAVWIGELCGGDH
ncbi:GmrSD restriction endonuclease domain-containing protein [Actinoplanes cyaneus]|uniref:GmrSD restriction endonuclease domain-containing protein n=1 Tax=Actinoplanes cyaneus TaxID=52696 RepID=UPI00194233AE